MQPNKFVRTYSLPQRLVRLVSPGNTDVLYSGSSAVKLAYLQLWVVWDFKAEDLGDSSSSIHTLCCLLSHVVAVVYALVHCLALIIVVLVAVDLHG